MEPCDPHLIAIMRPALSRNDFRIAIICALPLEADAVVSTFDKHWDGEHKFGKATGDKNAYTTGLVGQHNVVLVHMPNMGTISASAVASNIGSSFPSIQLGLVVGICGTVPFHPKTHEEIILGDVIISTSVIQYDFGRQYDNGFERKKEIEDSLGRANREIRSFAAKLSNRHSRNRLERQLRQCLLELQKQELCPEYPGITHDRLYESDYYHKHRPGPSSCEACESTSLSCPKNCKETGCEEDRLVLRKRLQPEDASRGVTSDSHQPSVFHGRFGSGNSIIKSSAHRDQMSRTDGIIAFEMEGAGVWDELPTVVIKAACDYADSHKTKIWQEYAAATAAACMKAFLQEWDTPDQALQDSKQAPWLLPFHRSSQFVGRIDILEILHKDLKNPEQHPHVAIYGLGGSGKSAIAIELAFQAREKDPSCAVYWVSASTTETFQESYREIARLLQIPGAEDMNNEILDVVQRKLSGDDQGSWLMIVDNVDDKKVLLNQDSKPENHRLYDYLPRSRHGMILFTTRIREVATELAPNDYHNLGKMENHEAEEFVRKYLVNKQSLHSDSAIKRFLSSLTCLPLAIVQALAFMKAKDSILQLPTTIKGGGKRQKSCMCRF